MSCANIDNQHGGKPGGSRTAAFQNENLDHITAMNGSRNGIFITPIMLAHDISRQKLTFAAAITDHCADERQRKGDEKTTQHAG
ncbi:hypothetical protein AFK67_04470 [Cronobacter dublinensis subsp. dublinensis LMG 23823]|nr:hypothetical protein AFK67_04470 [Cronobacter dublinensis subsp. dublinensis LMG 23823]